MIVEFDQANQQISYCIRQRRYRVAWITGRSYSGKSSLARQLCDQNGWCYLDYTLTPGYFDSIGVSISHYQPAHFIDAIRAWCAGNTTSALVIDEIDPLLATWSFDQRNTWASQVSRLPYLPCGLVFVSNFFDRDALINYLPDKDPRYCLDITGVNQ
jgi:hypothetical protein